MWTSCEPEQTPEEEAFEAQAPQPRFPSTYANLGPPHYAPVVRAHEPSIDAENSSIQALVDHWNQHRTIATLRVENNSKTLKGEHKVLLEAYASACTLHLEGSQLSDFRDALVDSMAEFLDDWGLDFFPWTWFYRAVSSDERMGDSPLLNLVAFYWVLTPPADSSIEAEQQDVDGLFERACNMQKEGLTEGLTTKEIWDDFMKSGRCEFHTHANGRCWMQSEEVEEEEIIASPSRSSIDSMDGACAFLLPDDLRRLADEVGRTETARQSLRLQAQQLEVMGF